MNQRGISPAKNAPTNRTEILNSSVGERLRDLRESARLTQEQLAVKAGISTSIVSRIERGAPNITLATLSAISDVLANPLARNSTEILIEMVGATRESRDEP